MSRYFIGGLLAFISYQLLAYSRNNWYSEQGTWAFAAGMAACFLAGYLFKEEN